MKKYQEIETDTPETFKRMTGLSHDNFQYLCDKANAYIDAEKTSSIEKTWFKKFQTVLSRLCIANTLLSSSLSDFYKFGHWDRSMGLLL